MMDISIAENKNDQLIDTILPSCNRDQMINGAQIRAARALLGWSPYDLAERAGLSYATIQRAEAADGVSTGMRVGSLMAIQRALESGGVVFLAAGEQRQGGPGVRLRSVAG